MITICMHASQTLDSKQRREAEAAAVFLNSPQLLHTPGICCVSSTLLLAAVAATYGMLAGSFALAAGLQPWQLRCVHCQTATVRLPAASSWC
jgi:hypothetical protein